MSASSDDARFMAAAIRLARRNEGRTATNPSVACLIVRDDGDGPFVVGSGITAPGGRPHAEPVALAAAGAAARGATAYVTLEPCAHHGRTPPCARTLIDAGIARVVIAATDPDPRVDGKGRAMLEQAGVEVVAGVLAEAAAHDLAGYLTHKRFGRPFVTLKLAVSADDYIGRRGREPVAVTGPVARAQVHLMRASHHAILVGAGTAVADDPELTCRLPGLEGRSPTRIVLDPRGRVAESARLFATARTTPTLIVAPPGRPAHAGAIAAGCELLACELSDGRVALPELLEDLGARGVMSLMVEGGAEIAAGFLAEGLVDAVALFRSPQKLKGEGEPVASPLPSAAAPAGFVADGEWKFGADRLNCFVREG